MPEIDDDLRRAYAPTGRLRAALNHGNRVLVSRDADGTPRGITVDLATRLAALLEVPLDFVHHDRAVDVSSSATSDAWDVCFLAVDPKRAETIAFTMPYVQIDGSYLVPPGSPHDSSGALVASGAPVGTVRGSAYTLTLERQDGAEHLVHFETFAQMMEALDAGSVAAAAGIGAVMETEATARPGARVLAPPFMQIRQAMGMPADRPEAAAHLRAFVEDLARSGETGDTLERHGVARSCAVLPG